MIPLVLIIFVALYIAYIKHVILTLLFIVLSLIFICLLYKIIKEYSMYELISWTLFIGGMSYSLYFLGFLAMDELVNL
jgi:hypothetical protein